MQDYNNFNTQNPYYQQQSYLSFQNNPLYPLNDTSNYQSSNCHYLNYNQALNNQDNYNYSYSPSTYTPLLNEQLNLWIAYKNIEDMKQTWLQQQQYVPQIQTQKLQPILKLAGCHMHQHSFTKPANNVNMQREACLPMIHEFSNNKNINGGWTQQSYQNRVPLQNIQNQMESRNEHKCEINSSANLKKSPYLHRDSQGIKQKTINESVILHNSDQILPQSKARQEKLILQSIEKGSIDKVLDLIRKYKIDLKSVFDDDNLNQNAMFPAALIKDEEKSLQMATLMLEMDVLPNYEDKLKQTPLFYASREGNLKLMKFLIDNGCSVNHSDNFQQTPLYYGCKFDHLAAVRLLVEEGCDVNHSDHMEQTPIYYAITSRNILIVKYMIEKGSFLSKIDKKGKTPLQWAKSLKKTSSILQIIQLIEDTLSKLKELEEQKEKSKVEELKKNPDKIIIIKSNPKMEKESAAPSTLSQSESQKDTEKDKPYPWLEQALIILKLLNKDDNKKMFRKPIDPISLGIIDYFDIIQKPMDFSTIKKRLLDSKYQTAQEYVNDIRLVYKNSYTYNGEESVVGKYTFLLEEKFDKYLNELGFHQFL